MNEIGNSPASADFVNLNLDVAYLEAWIGVDDTTAVALEVPEVKGRYYTAQLCDEWGEVFTNINEGNYPLNPYGKFENNWLGTVVIGNYADDYYTRSAANLVGIWANASSEVIYALAVCCSAHEPLDPPQGTFAIGRISQLDIRPGTATINAFAVTERFETMLPAVSADTTFANPAKRQVKWDKVRHGVVNASTT
jgi:hypothetical protein